MIVIIDKVSDRAHVFTTKAQANKFLSVSKNTIDNWIKSGETKEYLKYKIYFDCDLVKARQ